MDDVTEQFQSVVEEAVKHPSTDVHQQSPLTAKPGTVRETLNVGALGDYLLITVSAAFAGYGTSSFWIGASALFGLIAIYRPSR